MKLLIIDIALDGHHKAYLKSLSNCNSNNENYLLIPNCDYQNELSKKTYTFDYVAKNLICYLKLMRLVNKIVREDNIDIVHFLTGDVFYRYFGFRLKNKKCKTVITFHHIRRSRLKDISVKRIFRNIDVGVVHTNSLKNMLNNDFNIANVKHIEYPYFGLNLFKTKEESKQVLDIYTDNKILACIGGTREDKGLDIMLEALNKVDNKFHLLIAGAEQFYKKDFIDNKISKYKKDVTQKLSFLTDEELYHCINCANFIVLPYRKIFDGASGPLTEGVSLGKTIIGPNHGSLGQIITDNHLGYTFEAENVADLARVINLALNEEFKYDEVANAYRESLKEEKFQENYRMLYEELNENCDN